MSCESHEAEVHERWGGTPAYEESVRRTGGYSAKDWERMQEEQEQVEADLADCLRSQEPVDGPRAQSAVERHRRLIDTWFYPCSPAMQVVLAELYVSDGRFATHYDDRQPGLARYVHDAIVASGTLRAV